MGVNLVNLSNGESIIDLRNDTVGKYDLYNGKTAHGADGEPITGGLVAHTAVLTGASTGCTSTKLRFECPFKPTHITALYLAGSYQANKVHAITAWLGGYYCATSLGAVSSGKYALYRSQFTLAEDNNYFYWDGTYVYLASPNSTYQFATTAGYTYRVFAFK